MIIQHLFVLSLLVDFYKSEGQNKHKNQQLATKVQDKALPLPSTGEISAATRHPNNGANGAPDVILLFLGNHRHRHWWILHCPTVKSYGSETPSIGGKRAGSPGPGNQSGGRKKRSGQEINNWNNGKGNKGNGQGPGKNKRGFGPNQLCTKKLACLFYKLDDQGFHCCIGFNFSRWSDVLQHLKRKHLIEGDHCPKCREEFEGELAEADKDEHIRQDTCVERTVIDTGLLLQDEYDDLNGLHGTHEEKWYKAWGKLFGDHPAPDSPFSGPRDYSTVKREIAIILQLYRRDILARPEDDTTSNTLDAILRLLPNPIATSNSLVQDDAQDVVAPSALTQISLVQDVPSGHDPTPWLNTIEPYRPSPGELYGQPQISMMEARPLASPEMPNGVLWTQPLEETALLVDEDEIFRQWMNCPEDGQYTEEFDNIGHTLE